MPLKITDANLLIKYKALLASRRGRRITKAQYEKRKEKLEDEQDYINFQKEQAIKEAKRRAKEEEKKYINQLKKKLDNLNNNNIAFDVNMTKIPKSVKLDDVIDTINKKSFNKKNVISAGNKNITLNQTNQEKLKDAFRKSYYEGEEEIDSWTAFVGQVKSNNSSFSVSNVATAHTYNAWAGAWFKYNHKMDFDFKSFGIYKVGEKTNYDDSCLIDTFNVFGLDEKKLEMLKIFVVNRNVPVCKLEEICDKLQVCIHLNKNDKRAKTVYGKKYETIYNIGLIENHYFPIMPINITSYAIKHYNDIKHLPEWNYIYKFDGKYFKKDIKRTIDSFEAIKLLVENKETLLQEIDFSNSSISSSQFYDKVGDNITTLEYDSEINCIPVTTSKLDKDEMENVFFDFETYLDDNNNHVPYLVCYYIGNEKHSFFGEYCAYNFLKSLKKNTRLIAHNANYDYRFLVKLLRGVNEISRGSRLIGCSGTFHNIKVEIKDSYHLISKPLRDFPSSFKLGNVVKEVMPYSLYNKETISKRFIDIDYVLDNFIDDKDKEQFLNNIKRWNLQKDNTYDIVKYSEEYCFIDCDILQKGYNIFRTWMLETVSIDINKIMTIASLAHRYFVNEGCYDGVFQLSGVPQIFIQGSVVGGRTMVSDNKKYSIEDRVNDFDAVSLYPSAMKRMDGFLKGKPKVIDDKSYDFISKQDGYFVDIIINSVGIKRSFPLMSFKNQEGIRMFSNDMVGKTIRVDKYSLEDLIKFHEITFDVIRGYYFNEGFNTRINTVIEFLFNERANKKKQGNPIQEVYKLIMNSGYGKSIMKPIDSETNIFDDVKQFKTYLSRNYNFVKEFTYFGDKVKVKSIKPINDHYNIAHVGSMILSMSKRIMNEVMCSAEDNNIKLYYQDTDSIHIKDEDISKLSSIFKQKYNRDLIGKNLGQFHSDFQLDGCKDIIANASIFLGKKCYIDRLEGIDNNGEKQIDYHIRMKGIPNAVILYTSKKLGYANPFEMYKDLYEGKSIEFDLTNDGTKANFKMNKDYSVQTLEVFKRTIKF